jgi:hypothetical protein
MDNKVKQAAPLLHIDVKGKLSVTYAMKCAGFADTEIGNPSIKKRVYQAKDCLEKPSMAKDVQVGCIVEGKMNQNLSTLISLPLTQDSDSTRASSFSSPPSGGGTSITSASTSTRSSSSLTLKEILLSKMRLTSNQAAAVHKEAALEKELSDHHFVEACKMYKGEVDLEAQAIQNGQKCEKKSAHQICDDINKKTSSNISEQTIQDFVMKDRVGETIKIGRTGDISLCYYKSLLGTLESFVKLAHQQGHKTLTKKVLQQQLNVCINKHSSEGARGGRALLKRVENNHAATLDITKPNKVENRGAKWTTHYNVDIWYKSVKAFFIEYGFARLAGNDCKGKLHCSMRSLHGGPPCA